MQHSVLTRLSGHTVHPDKVCLTVSCVYTHPVQGLASLRTLDYNSMHTITWIARRLKDVRLGGGNGMQLVRHIVISPNAFTSISALFWNVMSPRWSASLSRVGGAVGGNSFL